ncbi:MAG: hypothetical protein GXO02_02980 [Epsilonproteobacteria bacterium]|nr:hypothetical protein [Campylobacterota bacterium]
MKYIYFGIFLVISLFTALVYFDKSPLSYFPSFGDKNKSKRFVIIKKVDELKEREKYQKDKEETTTQNGNLKTKEKFKKLDLKNLPRM